MVKGPWGGVFCGVKRASGDTSSFYIRRCRRQETGAGVWLRNLNLECDSERRCSLEKCASYFCPLETQRTDGTGRTRTWVYRLATLQPTFVPQPQELAGSILYAFKWFPFAFLCRVFVWISKPAKKICANTKYYRFKNVWFFKIFKNWKKTSTIR